MTNVKPNFDEAIRQHLECISNRDINAFRDHMTQSDTMYTIVQNGYAFKTPSEIIAIHEEWFKDLKWVWEGEVVHTIEGEDMGMTLIKYDYRAKEEDIPVSTFLVYVWKIEDGKWRIVHDQNTSLDFPAFARSAGM